MIMEGSDYAFDGEHLCLATHVNERLRDHRVRRVTFFNLHILIISLTMSIRMMKTIVMKWMWWPPVQGWWGRRRGQRIQTWRGKAGSPSRCPAIWLIFMFTLTLLTIAQCVSWLFVNWSCHIQLLEYCKTSPSPSSPSSPSRSGYPRLSQER